MSPRTAPAPTNVSRVCQLVMDAKAADIRRQIMLAEIGIQNKIPRRSVVLK